MCWESIRRRRLSIDKLGSPKDGKSESPEDGKVGKTNVELIEIYKITKYRYRGSKELEMKEPGRSNGNKLPNDFPTSGLFNFRTLSKK